MYTSGQLQHLLCMLCVLLSFLPSMKAVSRSRLDFSTDNNVTDNKTNLTSKQTPWSGMTKWVRCCPWCCTFFIGNWSCHLCDTGICFPSQWLSFLRDKRKQKNEDSWINFILYEIEKRIIRAVSELKTEERCTTKRKKGTLVKMS